MTTQAEGGGPAMPWWQQRAIAATRELAAVTERLAAKERELLDAQAAIASIPAAGDTAAELQRMRAQVERDAGVVAEVEAWRDMASRQLGAADYQAADKAIASLRERGPGKPPASAPVAGGEVAQLRADLARAKLVAVDTGREAARLQKRVTELEADVAAARRASGQAPTVRQRRGAPAPEPAPWQPTDKDRGPALVKRVKAASTPACATCEHGTPNGAAHNGHVCALRANECAPDVLNKLYKRRKSQTAR
jgi:hypothetical protein